MPLPSPQHQDLSIGVKTSLGGRGVFSLESNSLLFVLYIFFMPHTSAVWPQKPEGGRDGGGQASGLGQGWHEYQMSVMTIIVFSTTSPKKAPGSKLEMGGDRRLSDMSCFGLRPKQQRKSSTRTGVCPRAQRPGFSLTHLETISKMIIVISN